MTLEGFHSAEQQGLAGLGRKTFNYRSGDEWEEIRQGKNELEGQSQMAFKEKEKGNTREKEMGR